MSVLQLFDEARLPHFPQIVCHRPQDIEAESMRTIEKELYRLGKEVPPELRPVVYRAVHATADFDYADTLTFSPEVMDKALSVLALEKPRIVTDTKMALSGISRPACEKLGIDTLCFMADDDVAAASGKSGLTRAACSVDKAVRLYGADSSPLVFACGNAPTALVRIRQLFTGLKAQQNIMRVSVLRISVVDIVRHDQRYIQLLAHPHELHVHRFLLWNTVILHL